MYLVTNKSTGSGGLTLPPSKSHTQRALLFALMGKGTSTLRSPLISNDTKDMLVAIQKLGANLLCASKSIIQIQGTGGSLTPPDDVLWAGNSGQILRFIGALAALLPTYTLITGDLSVRKNRPILPLMEGIRQLGGFAESSAGNNQAPLIIRGPMSSGRATIDGECSQAVSGLLMACSFLDRPTELFVTNAGEKPWIALTLHWMDKLQLPYEHTDFKHFLIQGGGSYEGFEETIPGDLSSLAFPLTAAILTDSEVTIDHVDRTSCQGDGKIIDLLLLMGASIEEDPLHQRLFVRGGHLLQGGVFDINDMIDAIPILSVIGCFCQTPLTLINGSIARKKESDRIFAIAQELTKMGASLEEREDGLTIFPSSLKGARVSSHQDHRIALALAVAGLTCDEPTYIEQASCIEKSYPHFVQDLQRLGFSIQAYSEKSDREWGLMTTSLSF